MNDLHLRIGDADRERAAAALGEHFAEGRLSVDEHAERLDAVWTARTAGDVVPLFEDLPPPGASVVPERAPVRTRGRGSRTAGPRGWLAGVPMLPLLVLLVAASIATGWPLWLAAVLLWWTRGHLRARPGSTTRRSTSRC